MKVCSLCQVSKELSEFHKRAASKDGLASRCRACKAAENADWYSRCDQVDKIARKRDRVLAIKAWVSDYKAAHPCVDCGLRDHRVMDFDHVRGTKSMEISDMIRRGFSLDKIKEEIEKCDVRCSNCHRIRHYEEEVILGRRNGTPA